MFKKIVNFIRINHQYFIDHVKKNIQFYDQKDKDILQDFLETEDYHFVTSRLGKTVTLMSDIITHEQ